MSSASPFSSPLRRPFAESRVYSDRYIPSRTGSNLHTGFTLLSPGSPQSVSTAADASKANMDEFTATYSTLLKSELLGVDAVVSDSRLGEEKTAVWSPQRNLFRYQAPVSPLQEQPSLGTDRIGIYSRMGSSPRRVLRKISKKPFKVLDAPALQDDFYLNVVDWSAQNILAVGLGMCVYLWSACTSKVTKLCDLGPAESVTSVNWSQQGQHLAIGTSMGEVQIWDAARCRKVRTMSGHDGRVGTCCWSSNANAHILCSGSRDRQILQRDVREARHFTCGLVGHKQEVCGLKWSFDDMYLASGGNDNKLLVWRIGCTTPIVRFTEHTAAVKAIAWSPHQHGILASGGGTADRCIRFYNMLTHQPLNYVDTGSQVCNLSWSKNVNEIVSTHGYSQNQVIVWRYPTMAKVTTLTGHTLRVLYLAISPDGETIVTGAGDETLRFWSVFPGAKSKGSSLHNSDMLSPSRAHIR